MTCGQTRINATWLKASFLTALVVLVLAWPVAGALAQAPAPTGTTNPPATRTSGSAAVGMPIPLANISIQQLIGRIIQYVLGISGVIAMVMFIYGGLTWMMAQGNQEKITSAKNTVVWSVIGLVLIFSSYAIAKFIIDALQPK